MSDKKYKVFVGTLYSGEGDFAQCVKAIEIQKDVSVEHCVISNLPEAEAHNKLWTAWKSAKESGEFDFFTKIDADTVLVSKNTLKQIGEQFDDNPRITGIQCPLHDYYTDDLINGLNSFSPKVIFRETTDKLYCDRVDTGHDVVLRKPELPQSLIPAGLHCHYSSEIHAFHYGLHRCLKNQHVVLGKVRTVWEFEEKKDRLRTMALLGAHVAKTWNKNDGFNYQDKPFQKAYEHVLSNYCTMKEQL